ncbi:MAG: tRNA (adenine(22)-N(1))-methyltransferase TrmK [Planctomycetia bacterium]|nr:tRNA (adenine(22)-N(1))-methyltransferase TrmK [Planctomycetia bacterium]
MKPAPDRSLLSRVLEPEVMDSPEDALDYDAMDHSEVNRRFVADFLDAQRQAGIPLDVEVLDVGTGTALIPIELCARNPQARVVAIDLAEHMLRLARGNVVRHGLGRRISLQLVDAKRLPFADGRLAAVISNSIVHHIPEPRTALAEALRVLKSGGLVFVRDLARPYNDEQVRNLVDAYAAECNTHQRQLFEASLRAALSLDEIKLVVVQLGFDAKSVQATSDRHWTWSAVKK